jgi:hypothetical protein
MTVFRWIMLFITGTLFTGSVASFVLFIAVDVEVWIERARALRRLTFATALFWFNVEIWGRVVWTLWHWNPPGA